jgi:ribonuclease-3
MPISSERSDEEILNACQERLAYSFVKPELLRAALTHSSSANSRAASNERLEFLGDSILGLVVCDLLFRQFPDYQEGDLTKIKSVLVSRKVCAEIGKSLGLGEFLFVGKTQFGRDWELPANLIANVFESLIAAIFLDGGWEAARDFVTRHLGPEVEKGSTHVLNANAKADWQTMAQKELGGTPRYLVLDEQGPDHDKCFKVTADVNGIRYPPAWGRNKKEAEIKAALNAIASYRGRELPYPC